MARHAGDDAVIRLKLWIAYDGGPFRGWQSQAGGGAVQDHIEAGFSRICGRRIVVHGAGRTDAGVHALRQCAHVEIEPDRLPLAKWRDALNAHLPREIRVLSCHRALPTFHARFSAKGKIYVYRIWNHPVHLPLEAGRSWHILQPLDLARFRESAASFVGRHDFAAFAANRGAPVADTHRTIHRLELRQRGPLLTITVAGDGFLYRMVRLITGTLVRCAQGRMDAAFPAEMLAGKSRVKSSHCAPAHGLYLARVLY